MKRISLFVVALFSFFMPAQSQTLQEKPFVFIIPSFNNATWYEWNLSSIFKQNYTNYRVIYIDDCSTDGTADLVQNYVAACNQQHRFTLIRNTKKCLQLANRYKAIYQCEDNEIMVMLDGDDAMASPEALATLNRMYHEKDIWATYGGYRDSCLQCMWPEVPGRRTCKHEGRMKWAKPYGQYVIDANSFRQQRDGPFHLRTFYAWLYKNINPKDLYINGRLISLATDTATFIPILEMAGTHIAHTSQILCFYNRANVLSINNDSRKEKRWKVVGKLRKKRPYQPLEKPGVIKRFPGEVTPKLVDLFSLSSSTT